MFQKLTGALMFCLAASLAHADAPRPAAANAKVDESALRYYASLNQRERVKVETARLRKLYPEWSAPDDLYSAINLGGEDESAFWDLFAADRMTELRNAIAARQRAELGWKPSADLSRKIRSKELRRAILELWKAGKTDELIALVKQESYGGDDADVDILWTIAEAYARQKQIADAVASFASILKSNGNVEQRLATVQKAMAVLRMSDVEPLLALGRASPDGSSEWKPIMVDIVRARISAYLHDERAEDLPQAELALFQDYARRAADPNQPGLVAWYYYKRAAYRDGLEWFKQALASGGDAMIAHGLAHSLRALGLRRETEEVAYAWRQPLVNNGALFIDILENDLTLEVPPFIEQDRLNRYARVVMETAAGEGAQGLAWYAYNSCQFEVALEWFRRGVAWAPKEATVTGYALTLRRLKRTREVAELANRYDGLFPQLIALIFPDETYHPPTPCDLPGVAQAKPRPVVVDNVTVPGSARMPSPEVIDELRAKRRDAEAREFMRRVAREPKINRAEFPIAVDPQNGLRAAAAPTPPQTRPLALDQAQAPSTASQREPAQPIPLVARRVPGVGTMPYERYGYMLLPGWDGATQPSSPTHAALIAPAGTLWAEQRAKGEGDVAPQGLPPIRGPGPQDMRPMSGAGGAAPLGRQSSAAPQYFSPGR